MTYRTNEVRSQMLNFFYDSEDFPTLAEAVEAARNVNYDYREAGGRAAPCYVTDNATGTVVWQPGKDAPAIDEPAHYRAEGNRPCCPACHDARAGVQDAPAQEASGG